MVVWEQTMKEVRIRVGGHNKCNGDAGSDGSDYETVIRIGKSDSFCLYRKNEKQFKWLNMNE